MTYGLVRRADVLITMDGSSPDDTGTEIAQGSLLLGDREILAVGSDEEIMSMVATQGLSIAREIDARGHVVLPGLVNTHHHFYQTLTRAVPAGQDAELFDWLVTHYPIWARMDRDALAAASQVAAWELLLSGCTTASDHTYLWPNDCRPEDQIEAVAATGLRFHCSRGSMSVGESLGGLPPDSVVEDEAAILSDTARVIEGWHDAAPLAMTRIVVAPCSPFSVSPDLMRESARLARSYGVHMHTHLAETRDEEEYCRRTMGMTPVELAESVDWTGTDVWFAHMVHPHPEEIRRLGHSRCGAAHCPTSNMRLGSGIAPVRAMHEAGMRIGLGVDGSASNDGSHMLAEARQAFLLQRVSGLAVTTGHTTTVREALWYATRGGAAVLGRDDIGSLAPGTAADIVGFRTDTLGMAGGAIHDPVGALLLTQPGTVSFSLVNGVERVRDGEALPLPGEPGLGELVASHNRAARRMVEGT